MEGEPLDPIGNKARSMVYGLYQLFKSHPHDEQWTKESRPLLAVSLIMPLQYNNAGPLCANG